MEITYKNNKMKRVCTNAAFAERTYGNDMAEKIHMRVDEITAAENVEEMIRFRIGRCHQLKLTEEDNML